MRHRFHARRAGSAAVFCTALVAALSGSADGQAPALPELTATQTMTWASLGGAPWAELNLSVTNNGAAVIEIAPPVNVFSGTRTLWDYWCQNMEIAPGATITCRTSYATSQEDAVAGEIANTVTVHGTRTDGTAVAAAPVTTVAGITPQPRLDATIAKTSTDRLVAAGDTVTVDVEVSNWGNVDLTDISLEPHGFTGTGTFGAFACPAPDLAIGKTMTCTSEYAATTMDINMRTLLVDVLARGAATLGERDVVSHPGAFAGTIHLPTAIDTGPELRLSITASKTVITEPKQEVTVTMHMENNGDEDLTNLSVDGPVASGSGTLSGLNCPENGSLATDEVRDCTAKYKVTAADLTAGEVLIRGSVEAKKDSEVTVTSPEAAVSLMAGSASPASPGGSPSGGSPSASSAAPAPSGSPGATPSATPTGAGPATASAAAAISSRAGAPSATAMGGAASTTAEAESRRLAMTGPTVTTVGTAAVVMFGTGVMLVRRRKTTQE